MDDYQSAGIVLNGEFSPEFEIPNNTTPESICIAMESLRNLSDEAKHVISLIIDTPQELQNMMRFEFELTRVKEFLRLKGWKIETIRSAIKEIKSL